MNLEPGSGKSKSFWENQMDTEIIDLIRKFGDTPQERRTFRDGVVREMVKQGWPEWMCQEDMRAMYERAGVEWPE